MASLGCGSMGKRIMVKKTGGGRPGEGVFVTIRRKGIAFSSGFARLAGLGDNGNRFVTFYLVPDERQLEMEFSPSSPDHGNGYKLNPDGGIRRDADGEARAKLARECQPAEVIATPWIKAISLLEGRLRRFEPERLDADRWRISLMPSFEQSATDASGVPDGVAGIYRYVRKDGDAVREVVYIGEGGDIRRRLRDDRGRDTWEFDEIQFSEIAGGKQQCERWERFWLDRFQQEHGRLPIYNKIGGKETSNAC